MAVALGISLIGCGIPRDAGGTLGLMKGGVMRVGMVINPPWVIESGSGLSGIEGTLAGAVASAVGARVEVVRGPEFELIRALNRRELQLVVGGFDRRVRWAEDVALTAPYLKTPDGIEHVLAAPPGENAWLMRVESVLRFLKPSIPAMLAQLAPSS